MFILRTIYLYKKINSNNRNYYKTNYKSHFCKFNKLMKNVKLTLLKLNYLKLMYN